MTILSSFYPFYQFLWTAYFITMFLSGFWCILFFFTFIVPLWITEGLAEYYGKINKNFNPEDIRSKMLFEQEGVEVLYQRATTQPLPHTHH